MKRALLIASLLIAATLNAQQSAPKVNVNTATVAQLCFLPGVGAKTAAAIVDYRTVHGQFYRASDLLQVKGFGPKKLAKVVPYVVVAGPTTASAKIKGGAK